MKKMMTAINKAVSEAELAACRVLFSEYAEWLREDICLAGFTAEIAALPGKYAPPEGGLLLATIGNEAAGCIAFRKFDDTAAEAKRLWVRPQFRNQGVGVELLQAMQQTARDAGYQRVVFDTLPKMVRALQLYESMGFLPRQGPDPSLLYFEKSL